MSNFKTEFPGIPLVESPIFEREIDKLGLSSSERDIALRLHRDGFAVIDFPDADLDMRIRRVRASLSPIFGIDDTDPQSLKFGSVTRVQDAWRENEDVRAIASNALVLELLGKLYGRKAFPFQTLNFPVGTEQPLHTDAVHFSSIPKRFMCGVWLAMEDIRADAGPLCYIPGSHRWPMLDNAAIGNRAAPQPRTSAQLPFHDAWTAMIEVNGGGVQKFEAKKGQALIWSANLLHGGCPHIDKNHTRWSQVTHYYFEDCIYYTPAFSNEYLGDLFLREPFDIAEGRLRRSVYHGRLVKNRKNTPNLLSRFYRALRNITDQ